MLKYIGKEVKPREKEHQWHIIVKNKDNRYKRTVLLCKDKQKKTGKVSKVLSDKIKMDKEESSKRPNKNKI